MKISKNVWNVSRSIVAVICRFCLSSFDEFIIKKTNSWKNLQNSRHRGLCTKESRRRDQENSKCNINCVSFEASARGSEKSKKKANLDRITEHSRARSEKIHYRFFVFFSVWRRLRAISAVVKFWLIFCSFAWFRWNCRSRFWQFSKFSINSQVFFEIE